MRLDRINRIRTKGALPGRGVFFNLLLVLALISPVFLAGAAHAVTTKMKHTPPNYFVADQRIQLEAKVTDDQGVKLVRCYFKAAGEADLVFVSMNAVGSDQYAGILPAPSAVTTQIEYLFLAVNQANQVVRSQNFTMYKDANKKTPAWQNISKEGEIRVSIELDQAPTQLVGFSDNVAIDVVESGARFGVVALLYHAATDSNSKEAAALGASSGGATTTTAAATTTTATTTAAATATGATSAGIITAGAAGWSTAAIVGVGLGVAAVAGGTAAAVSGGDSGGGGGNDEPQELTEKTIAGDWNVNGTSIYDWTTFGNITFNKDDTYSYNLKDKAPDQPVNEVSGTGTWTLVGNNLTLRFDAGAVYNGTASGDSNAFVMVSDNGWTLNFIRR